MREDIPEAFSYEFDIDELFSLSAGALVEGYYLELELVILCIDAFILCEELRDGSVSDVPYLPS